MIVIFPRYLHISCLPTNEEPKYNMSRDMRKAIVGINANSKDPDQPAETLRKHAYSNILKILPAKKKWKFSEKKKKNHIFYFSAPNIDCRYPLEPPRRGGSNVYPQSMFLSRNKKKYVYPCNPVFFCFFFNTKVGFKGVGAKLYRHVFLMYTVWSEIFAILRYFLQYPMVL